MEESGRNVRVLQIGEGFERRSRQSRFVVQFLSCASEFRNWSNKMETTGRRWFLQCCRENQKCVSSLEDWICRLLVLSEERKFKQFMCIVNNVAPARMASIYISIIFSFFFFSRFSHLTSYENFIFLPVTIKYSSTIIYFNKIIFNYN